MTGTNIATLLNSRTAVSGNGTVQSIRQQFNTDPNLQKQDEDNYNYLAITNTNSDNYQFCLKVEKGSTLITDTSHVEVISRYNDTALGFQAIVYEPLLDYIIRPNTSLEMN